MLKTAREAFDEVADPAQDAFDKAKKVAWEAYQEDKARAWVAYRRVLDPALRTLRESTTDTESPP